MAPLSKPILLQLGENIVHNPQIYDRLSEQFTIIQPPVEERGRSSFIQALQKKQWGDFQGMFRPSMDSGGEMGLWDDELVSLLPVSVKIFASAGAGFDWVDTERLAEAGWLLTSLPRSSPASADSMKGYCTVTVETQPQKLWQKWQYSTSWLHFGISTGLNQEPDLTIHRSG